jgi:ATP-dependent Lon protease
MEKMKEQAALDVIGKITDRELNFSFTDKYFNFNLDLSEAIIILTANDLFRVAQFVRDRCKPVNIEFLT